MRVWVVLADTGRPSSTGGLNLLNAGWTSTTAMPLGEGEFTLVGQAVAAFVEAPWDQLNKAFRATTELIDSDGEHALMLGQGEAAPARAEHEVVVPPLIGAPNGIPGRTQWLWDLPAGSLRVRLRRQYTWRVTVDDAVGEATFWVAAPPMEPKFGGPTLDP